MTFSLQSLYKSAIISKDIVRKSVPIQQIRPKFSIKVSLDGFVFMYEIALKKRIAFHRASKHVSTTK